MTGRVVRVAGGDITALKLGKSRVKAMYGGVKSKPIDVDVVKTIADALAAHRVRQATEALPRRPAPPDPFADLVFTTTLGTPLDGISVTRRFQRVLKGAGLPRQRFHDLRHAAASYMLAAGVPARVVMETLGHSEISLTLNTYSHVLPGLGRDAADRMDALLGAA